MADAPTDPWKDAADVYGKTYAEVLLAIKHQDDKLGRVLTVLAFLTGAGIALFTQLRNSPAPFTSNLWYYVFVAFLVSVAGSVFFALAAIYPGTFAPGFVDDLRGKLDRYLLYFGKIASDDRWREGVETRHDRLQEDLARNYAEDAWLLSHHALYKMRRADESAAFLYVAVSCLVLFGIFALPVEEATAWAAATAFLGIAAALPLVTVLLPKDKAPPGLTRCIFAACALLAIASMVISELIDHEMIGLAIALALLLIARLDEDVMSFGRRASHAGLGRDATRGEMGRPGH